MCEYPLWLFDEEKLKEMGAEAYYKYTTEYDKYFAENLGVTEGNK